MENETQVKRPVGRPKVGYVADDETTPAHEARKRQAENYNKNKDVPVEKEWFEWKLPNTYDAKKERKLVKKAQTKNGVSCEFVGWERKIPSDFLNKLIKNGSLKV